ncbi:MAG: ZIP family metal transporter [Eubacteriales bacterium]|nr:ZIP family metal transporter [Christensenellaceae bacterium]MDY2751576.1 ZIP family metal transporter [Eubacteriales bacterium]MCI7769600.1 ZIP family metal transporter [Christensenellaceae bacterium]MDD6361463.1 ZIP family metal transporter [Christensenellaceae bacterium]MDD7092968.1 ZIP family metal transporter [Christensenellaceae bacterium]
MLKVLLYGAVSGIVGTMLGGVISAFLSKKDKVIGVLFAVAAGVMLAIVSFDLIPEAYAEGGVWTLAASVLAGVVLVVILDEITKAVTKKGGDIIEEGRKRRVEMTKTGILMMLAIAVHNLPEGLVIGSSELKSRGLLMALLIGLHNIPEGIAVAAPLIAGGMKKWKAILITASTGIPTLIGAVIGYYIGLASATFVAVSLGIAAGAMLAVIFAEMLPESLKLNESKAPGFAAVISVVIGAVAIYLFR